MARIKLKNSQVKDKAPLATDLDVGGEIAVNHHADNPGIFLKDTAGAVRKIAGPGSISTSAATEAAAGIVELATLAETATGTDATRAVHPAGLKALLSATLTPGSATAPAGPATGATYIDSSVSPAVVAVWDGAAWVKQVGTATTSATAPTTPVTGQVYLDTSTSPAVAKLWNGGAWINLTTDTAVQSKLDAQLGGIWTRTGTVLSPATAGDQVHTATGKLTVGGTAAAPNIEIKADGGIVANTDGLFYDAATKRLAIGTTTAKSILTAAGNIVGLGPGTHSWQHYQQAASSYTATSIDSVIDGAAGSLVFKTGPNWTNADALERARLTGSGQLLVGTSSARDNYFNTSGLGGLLQVEGANSQAQRAVSNTYGIASGAGPIVVLAKHRSNSIGGNTVVQSGDYCGELSFEGSDGTEFVELANIAGIVDGTPGANDMPGRLVFSTTADGASSPTERMRISQDSTIGFGNTVAAPAAPVFKMTLKASGVLNLATTTVYADNTAALAGGLVAGDIYRKADGTLMITF